jgi:hypothetical protein
MVLIGQIFFVLFVLFEYLTFKNVGDSHSEKVWNALAFTSLFIYITPYLSVHWIFAMKYWFIANDMQKIDENKQIIANTTLDFIYYFFLCINIAACIFVTTA